MPYALPKGVPALQADPAVTRRWMVVAIATSAVATGLAAFTVWGRGAAAAERRDESAPTQPPNAAPPGPVDEHLQWALELARGPRSELQRKQYWFFGVVERHPEYPELWQAVELLAEDAFGTGEDAAQLARRLFRLLSSADAPSRLAALRDRLVRHLEQGRQGR